VSGAAVHHFNGKWHLFLNVFRVGSKRVVDDSGEVEPARIDLVKVEIESDRTTPPDWMSKNAPEDLEDIIVNKGPHFCGAMTPGVRPIGGAQYELYFGLTARQMNDNGTPEDPSDDSPDMDRCFPAFQHSMERWIMHD